MADPCTWTRNTDDESGMYETRCDNAFLFSDGGVKTNEFRFCCYCGKQIKEVLYSDEDLGVLDAGGAPGRETSGGAQG